MVRPSLDNVPASLWAEAFNWACYVKNRLPYLARIDKMPYEVLFNKKPMISHLRPFYTKCYVHIPKEKRAARSKLDAHTLEEHLVGYTETTRMFRVYIPSQHKVDAYRQVKFEPSSYTSVAFYTPRPTSNNADQQILPHDHSRPTSHSDQLQSEVIQPQQQTTTHSSSQFPSSYPQTPVKSSSSAPSSLPLQRTLVPPVSAPRDFLNYTPDSDSESERDPDDPLPSPSTPHYQYTSTRAPAALKSSRTKEFDTVLETPKLSYEQRPTRTKKPGQCDSEHDFARLVAEPQSSKEAIVSLDSYV